MPYWLLLAARAKDNLVKIDEYFIGTDLQAYIYFLFYYIFFVYLANVKFFFFSFHYYHKFYFKKHQHYYSFNAIY